MNAFFVGIGGMGMSGLAKILHCRGFKVAGSDRNLDGDYCRRLTEMGIRIYLQDGKGPEKFMNETGLKPDDFKIVKSTAVESHVPDVVTAEKLQIAQIMRSDLLAEMFNSKKGIAIGGTAGKTTTTGLTAWIFNYAGFDPSCAVGGIISGLDTNALAGNGQHFIIEADESDGSIVKYRPWISVVTNISRDHKTMDELQELFLDFFNNTGSDGFRIICNDDADARLLKENCKLPVITYGINEKSDFMASNIRFDNDITHFSVNDVAFELSMPGEHNIRNALASIAAAAMCDIEMNKISEALKAFPGMKRRFEKVGTAAGVTIIDDFAHNPAEILAAVKTARKSSRRRFIVYQPHGYGPASFTRDDLIDVFSSFEENEFLYLDEIFYGGGTVNKNITSEEIVKEVQKKFRQAWYPGSRENIVKMIAEQAKDGDMVLVMGARDINVICKDLLQRLALSK